MVYAWCTDGVRMVYGWCTDGVRMVYGWCTDGVRSHLLATPKPPQSSYKAPTRLPQSRVHAWYKPHQSRPGGKRKPGNWADAPCASLVLRWGIRSRYGAFTESVPGIDRPRLATFQLNQRRIWHLHRRKIKGQAARGSAVRVSQLRAPCRGRRRDWGRAPGIPGLRTTRHPR